MLHAVQQVEAWVAQICVWTVSPLPERYATAYCTDSSYTILRCLHISVACLGHTTEGSSVHGATFHMWHHAHTAKQMQSLPSLT